MSWDSPIDSPIVAIHAALTPGTQNHPKGTIMYFGGFSWQGPPAEIRLFDLATNTTNANPVPPEVSPTSNVFCSGHAFLSDGRLVIGGGTLGWPKPGDPMGHGAQDHYDGEVRCWMYSPRGEKCLEIEKMNPEPGFETEQTGGGRWYPTLITLPGGQILAVAGHPTYTDHRHNNNRAERYSVSNNKWIFPSDNLVESDLYPRLHVLPNGKVFFSTVLNSNDGWKNRIYDPYSGDFDTDKVIEPQTDELYKNGSQASSILLPLLPGDNYTPRILVCGGIQPMKINLSDDISLPVWEPTKARSGPIRRNLNATILPTGEIFISGGEEIHNHDDTAIKYGETYLPGIDWNTEKYSLSDDWLKDSQDASSPRGYHSVALLMPDGVVWTAGSTGATENGTVVAEDQLNMERYLPSYYSDPNRPEIGNDVPVSIGYNQDFLISTTQASSIKRVALIRVGSVTHSFDADQRYVGLKFTRQQNKLTITSPPNPAIAPPGNYMLWEIKQNGIPCKEAKFIRLCDQRCKIVPNHSTFSKLEVEALLEQNEPEPAIFQQAFTVVFENFLPHEISSLGDHPDVQFNFDSENGQAVGDGMIPVYLSPWWEISPPPEDIAQTKTFVFNVVFKNKDAMDSIYSFQGAERRIKVTASFGHFRYVGEFILTKKPNPYINDVHPPYPEWLSVDLRVFKKHPNEEMQGTGVLHGDNEEAPIEFIRQVLDRFREIEALSPNDLSHPFMAITEEQMANGLEVAQEDNPDPADLTITKPVYNYAIAKVRYRALSQTAENVRVFFRLFNTVDTALEFNPGTTYRRSQKKVPLLGMQDNDIISIPFFAEKRITPEGKMDDQYDDKNVVSIPPHPSGSESVMYFGCWLDFNQIKQHIPLHPDVQLNDGNGPYVNQTPISIQEHIRNHHQCLVAEVFYENDPTPLNPPATPASSDNLSQRNLVIVDTANPGGPGSRTVQHTFEVKPSVGVKRVLDLKNILVYPSFHVPTRYETPDELVIIRNNLPPNTEITLYFPGIDVDDILTLAELRHAPPVLTRVDNHTINCKLGDVAYIPLPGGRTKNIPGLLSLEMPSGVTHGQLYTLTVQQISGGNKPHIIGSFQLNIPVKSKEEILPKEIRKLSVLRHIAKAIPPSDRWYPIFSRYLNQIAIRVREFGGNPDEVEPSPDGSGRSPEPIPLLVIPKERYTGKISQILYDCFGDFEGFILDLCPGQQVFMSKKKAIEQVITRACLENITVTVYVQSVDKMRPYKIGLHCD